MSNSEREQLLQEIASNEYFLSFLPYSPEEIRRVLGTDADGKITAALKENLALKAPNMLENYYTSEYSPGFWDIYPEVARKIIPLAAETQSPAFIIKNRELIERFGGKKVIYNAMATAEGAQEIVGDFYGDYGSQPISREGEPFILRGLSQLLADRELVSCVYFSSTFFNAHPNIAREIVPQLAEVQTPAQIALNFRVFEQFSGKKIVRDALQNPSGALGAIHLINALHNLPDKERYAILERADARNIYNIITLGRAEAYMSSYNGVLDRLITSLEREQKTLLEVLGEDERSRLPVFLEAAASFGRLDDVVNLIPPESLQETMVRMLDDVGKTQDFQQAIAANDLMRRLPAGNLKTLLEQELKIHYFQSTGKSHDIFGFLAAEYGRNGGEISPENRKFYASLAKDERYVTQDYTFLPAEALLDNRGVNVQRHHFYDDDDGRQTFQRWLAGYRKRAGWEITEKPDYVLLKTRSKDGTPIEIYANKPDAEEKDEAINQAIAASQELEVPIIRTVVHRGHSYHVRNTIAQLSPENNLVFLGSCGGYQNLSMVLEKAPDARVIATQGKGTFVVNEPLLAHLNETIQRGQGIEWKKEADFLASVDSTWAEMYLLPHTNRALAMMQRYKELRGLDKDTPEPNTPSHEVAPFLDSAPHVQLPILETGIEENRAVSQPTRRQSAIQL